MATVADYATHSMRVAAGQLLQRENFDGPEMRQLGRWRSDNYQVYTRPSWITVRRATHVLASKNYDAQISYDLDRPYHAAVDLPPTHTRQLFETRATQGLQGCWNAQCNLRLWVSYRAGTIAISARSRRNLVICKLLVLGAGVRRHLAWLLPCKSSGDIVSKFQVKKFCKLPCSSIRRNHTPTYLKKKKKIVI